MNDRYLFRGKRLDTGEWVQGSLSWSTHRGDFFISNYDGMFEIDPATVGQCTGLKDKNGKLIFEGDLLKLWVEGRLFYSALPVIYCELWCQFVADDKPHKQQFDIWNDFHECEVIGTIHDNPELLEN